MNDQGSKNIFLKAWRHWNTYWLSPQPTLGIGLFRIAFGLVVLLYHAPRLLAPNALYTSEAFLKPLPFWGVLTPFPLPLVLAVAFNVLLIAAIIAVIFGFRTKEAAALTFVLHLYLVTLERFSTRAFGDIIGVLLFLLIFTPAGAAASFDASRKAIREGIAGAKLRRERSPLASPLAAVLMRWQIASVYFFTVLYKIFHGGTHWIDGTAIQNVFLNPEWTRQPLGLWLSQLPHEVLAFMGQSIIIGELALAYAYVVPPLRILLVPAFLFVHGFVLVGMKVSPVFTFLMAAALILAVEPATWERWLAWLRQKTRRRQLALLYDGKCRLCQGAVAALVTQDILERIALMDVQTIQDVKTVHPELDRTVCLKEIHLVDGKNVFVGFFAFRRIARSLPLLWLIWPLLWTPGVSFVGVKIYRWIASRRYVLSCGIKGEHVCHL